MPRTSLLQDLHHHPVPKKTKVTGLNGYRPVALTSVVMKAFDRLLHEVQTISAEKAGKLTGQTLPVLVEEVNGQDASLVTGKLTNNSTVHFPGTADMIGTIQNVVLEECKGFYYIGRLA